MRRSVRLLLLSGAMVAVAAIIAACGTEHIAVPKAEGSAFRGAVLFSQRCSGCHTLSSAATHGSAPNVRTAQANSGPNFDQRCERPIDRVLYAIENGGFSGAVMPQNIVVGQDAADVAKFVATYAGRHSPKVIGIPFCESEPIGTLPAATTPTATIATPAAATTSASTSASTSTSTSTTTQAAARKPHAKRKSKKKKSARA